MEKSILEIDPVLLTQGAAAFVGICGALGVKELLKAMYDRWCRKSDEKDTDHKQLEELTKKVDKIIAKLDAMDEVDQQSIKNDLIILESGLADMQNRAILKDMVSSTCMPRYQKSYELYIKLAEATDGYETSEEVKLNHKRILQLIDAGKIADNIKEWYES